MKHVESSEWRTYVQECVHEDGIRVLRSLFANKNICIDMVKKAATAFFPQNEIDNIIEKIQNEIEESKATTEIPLCTREKALQIALHKVNQGYCLQYVSDGLKEWLGIEINPAELDTELSELPGLLSSYQQLRNAWHNIRHVEPDSITPFQIQEKYGFDWRYQEYVLDPCEDNEQDADSTAEPAQTNEVQTLAKRIIEQNREAYDSLASSDKERPE